MKKEPCLCAPVSRQCPTGLVKGIFGGGHAPISDQAITMRRPVSSPAVESEDYSGPSSLLSLDERAPLHVFSARPTARRRSELTTPLSVSTSTREKLETRSAVNLLCTVAVIVLSAMVSPAVFPFRRRLTCAQTEHDNQADHSDGHVQHRVPPIAQRERIPPYPAQSVSIA